MPSDPKDLKKPAKVNAVMGRPNTRFYRDFGYGLVYPQLFSHHKRRSDEAHAGEIAWGQQDGNNSYRFAMIIGSGGKNQVRCPTDHRR